MSKILTKNFSFFAIVSMIVLASSFEKPFSSYSSIISSISPCGLFSISHCSRERSCLMYLTTSTTCTDTTVSNVDNTGSNAHQSTRRFNKERQNHVCCGGGCLRHTCTHDGPVLSITGEKFSKSHGVTVCDEIGKPHDQDDVCAKICSFNLLLLGQKKCEIKSRRDVM